MRLAICSSKGGVGKTATAASLGTVFGRIGRTLVVDADPQESLGRAFGVVAGPDDSLAGVLADRADLRTAVRRDVADGVDLLPSHPSLAGTVAELATQGGVLTSIRRALRPVDGTYDTVVIDTPGDTGNLSVAAIAAADAVLAVFTSDPGSALGVVRIASLVAQHRRFENTTARLLGAVCSSWDRHGATGREVLEALETTDVPVFETRVPFSRRVPSATLAKRPVVLRAPNSPVAAAYADLADEILTAYREALAA